MVGRAVLCAIAVLLAHSPARQDGPTAEPADIQHWRDYVTTMARRYKGRVRHYEIWNEPNLKQFYTGSVATMAQLVREAAIALKDIDPTIVVVSPSATERGGIAWL